MNRKEAAELFPIIKAFSEGKVIEQKCAESWVEVDENCDFHFPANSYRIKPEPKYRPFKNEEECWNEMQKHQPIGYTKLIGEIEYSFITDVDDSINYSDAIKEYTFADGTPFGIKEE